MRRFFFETYGNHRDRPVLTHSFPTRRSSDLRCHAPRGLPSRPASPACAAAWPAPASSSGPDFSSRYPRLNPVPLSRVRRAGRYRRRSEEHTSELQSLMRISYAVFCLKKKKILTYKSLTVHTLYILTLCICTPTYISNNQTQTTT